MLEKNGGMKKPHIRSIQRVFAIPTEMVSVI